MKIELKENRPFATFKGRNITDTNHSIERSYERGEIDKDLFFTRKEYVDKHQLMISQAIIQILRDYKDLTGNYVIYSKGTGLGVAIDWRKDWYKDDGKNHAYVVTVLASKPKPHYLKYDSDIRIIVEAYERIREHVLENYDKRLLTESEEKEYKRFKTEEGFTVHMYEGKVIDVTADLILVD